MLLAALASTTILTSLPVMMDDLGAGQTAYTWVVASTLLTTTVSLAIWGKLADLFSHKRLMFVAIALFVVASLFAGLSPTAEVLIAFRALQGIGAGGLIAVGPVLLADLLSPRERGKYAGLVSGVIGIGTVGGPVIGGVITDSVGWRWNFYLGIPFAIAAVVLLERSLHLPTHTRVIRIDWLGALLIASGAGATMVWVTLSGQQFAWFSWPSWVLVLVAAMCTVGAWAVERTAQDPVIPLALFADKSISRVVVASIPLGIAMLAVPTFMSQYFQLSRGMSASVSGGFMMSMSVSTFLAASIIGRLISRTGMWKLWVVSGSAALLSGLAGLATLTLSTSLFAVSAYLLCIGFAVGILMQNLLIISQNSAPTHQLGAATALPAFFRQLSSAVGIAVLGAVLTTRISGTHIGRKGEFADAIGDLFLLCAPVAVVGLIATILLPNKPFGTENAIERTTSEPLAET